VYIFWKNDGTPPPPFGKSFFSLGSISWFFWQNKLFLGKNYQTFWLPESRSGSAKTYRSTDPDPRIQGAKYQPKTANKNILFSKPKSELLKQRENIKNVPYL